MTPPPADAALARRRALALAYVLTVGTGAMDAIGFARLGDVFTSVMTGNLVLLGVSAGSQDGELAARIGVAFVAFVAGVMLGSRVVATAPARDDERGFRAVWPAGVNRVLALQLVPMAVLAVGWERAGGEPEGGTQAVLLAAAAVAMGLQSGAVLRIGVPGLSTTYVTGTLTNVLADLATTGRLRWSAAGTLLSLVVGACTAGLLVVHADRWAVAVPVVALVLALAGGVRLRRGS